MTTDVQTFDVVPGLPKRVAFDASAIVRAMGVKPNQPESIAAAAVYNAVLNGGRTLVIPAPAYSEVILVPEQKALLPRKGIEEVPFDGRASRLFASHFPPSVWKQVASESGASVAYVKFDALILACVIARGVEIMVTTDDGLIKLAERVKAEAEAANKPLPQGMVWTRVVSPEDLRAPPAQPPKPEPEPPPPPGPVQLNLVPPETAESGAQVVIESTGSPNTSPGIRPLFLTRNQPVIAPEADAEQPQEEANRDSDEGT